MITNFVRGGKEVPLLDLWHGDVDSEDVTLLVAVGVVLADRLVEPGALATPDRVAELIEAEGSLEIRIPVTGHSLNSKK